MIHRTRPSWQQCLQTIVTDPAELLEMLELDEKYLPAAIESSRLFPLKAPRPFIERIQKGNIDDPLLRQIMPIQEELTEVEGYSNDPVAEQQGQQAGIIQKYHGRVLLMVNGHCAVNCRYCFRRHYPYEDNILARNQWETALATIADDTSIHEVIYSGGDPLASSDSQLAWLTEQIAAISHIKRLRIHTRLPIVIPQRINEACIDWMTAHHLAVIVVLHINHPNELQEPLLLRGIELMQSAGITLLNQAVLLKGVNDNSNTLIALSDALFEAGVMPYYLHVLDKVSGASHFDIPINRAKNLHKEVLNSLPGYMVPKLVQENPGEPSKTLL